MFAASGGGRHFRGMSSSIRSAGWVQTRIRTSIKYGYGPIPLSLQISMRLLCSAPHNSLIETCKLHRINPEAYLKDVLVRISNTPVSQIQSLMPRFWRPPLLLPPASL